MDRHLLGAAGALRAQNVAAGYFYDGTQGFMFSWSEVSVSHACAKTSSRLKDLPVTTSINSNIGATVPSSIIFDSVLDMRVF